VLEDELEVSDDVPIILQVNSNDTQT